MKLFYLIEFGTLLDQKDSFYRILNNKYNDVKQWNSLTWFYNSNEKFTCERRRNACVILHGPLCTYRTESATSYLRRAGTLTWAKMWKLRSTKLTRFQRFYPKRHSSVMRLAELGRVPFHVWFTKLGSHFCPVQTLHIRSSSIVGSVKIDWTFLDYGECKIEEERKVPTPIYLDRTPCVHCVGWRPWCWYEAFASVLLRNFLWRSWDFFPLNFLHINLISLFFFFQFV
jgi:hypothetical protein